MKMDEIHRVVVSANAVPNPDMLDPIALPPLLHEREGSIEMTQTTEPTFRSEARARSRSWRRFAIAGVLVAAALIAVALVQRSEPEDGLIAGQPPGLLDQYVAALQANDVEAAMAVLVSDVVLDFTPWLVGTDTSTLEVSDCDIGADEVVRCVADLGSNWFYSRITGEEMVTSIIVRIEQDGLDLIDIPAPAGIYSADADFGAWVREAHPDRHDEMYIGSTIKNGYDSGAARSELADEYIESAQ